MKFIGLTPKKETALLEAVLQATPTVGGENLNSSGAKIQNKPLPTSSLGKKLGQIVLAMATTADPDPMDWSELDSFSNKPPNTERKPRKKPHNKPEAIKRLEQVTGNKHRDDTANGLTRCIVDYLRYKGWQAERINTTGIPIDTRKQATDIMGHNRTIGSLTWRPSGNTKGSADISATIKGRSVKIEVKIGKDRQSEAQRQYQAAIEQAGGLYYIARDFTTFVAWYHQNFGKGGAK